MADIAFVLTVVLSPMVWVVARCVRIARSRSPMPVPTRLRPWPPMPSPYEIKRYKEGGNEMPVDKDIQRTLGDELYDELVKEGFTLDHHESDLYIKDSPLARELVEKHGLKYTCFIDDIEHQRWLDVPFAYAPFWREKNKHGSAQKAG